MKGLIPTNSKALGFTGYAACLILAACFASCSSTGVGSTNGDGESSSGKADDPSRSLFTERIETAAQFQAMSFSAGGVVIQGRSMKFLIDNRSPSSAKIYFQNANYKNPNGTTPDAARYHYYFAEAVLNRFDETLDDFNQVTYFAQSKRYFAGTIQVYRVGENSDPLYAIQFYPQDVIAEENIQKALKIVKDAFILPGAKLAFVATGPKQTTSTVGEAIRALSMQNLTVDQILGSVNYLPMNTGEAWGYLRIFPANPDDLTPMDIPVFDELPLDLSVVAGVITKAFQDASSHVNLKSKERNTPDMVLRNASPNNPLLAPLADKPIHLIVQDEAFAIEPTTEEMVSQKYRERTNKPWIAIKSEATEQLLSLDEMCPSQPAKCIKLSLGYGSKAANLGFLGSNKVLGQATEAGTLSQRLGYDLVPDGVGVPIQLYHAFVAYGPNADLRNKLDELITAEKAGTLSASQRTAKLQEVQKSFYLAQFPPGMVKSIQDRLAQALPRVLKLKVRSSANAEDLPNFDGAGLYDSFSANLGKSDNPDGSCQVRQDTGGGVETKLEVVPKTLACAIKGSYASLWNKRAIEERSFARLDHATAGMGLAIVAKYDNEEAIFANSVVVTRILGTDGLYGYTFSTQKGNNLVTNPLPGTYAENVFPLFATPDEPVTFTLTRYAKPLPDATPLTQTVLSTDQMKTMLEISRTVETAYCNADPGYYSGDCRWVAADQGKPSALDLEFKILDNGHFTCKQVREFSGH